jgi:hypothetical protein
MYFIYLYENKTKKHVEKKKDLLEMPSHQKDLSCTYDLSRKF